MHSSHALCDDWNRHWSDFSAAGDMAPATRYRQQLCIRLLGLAAPGDGVRLLDIGSGTGAFAELFCSRFSQAAFQGLELSQTGVDLAARRVPQAQFLQRDLMAAPNSEGGSSTSLDGAGRRFTATHAVCSEVLEHLDDPLTFLRNTTPYLAPHCRLVVTVPGGKPNAFDTYIGHRRHYFAEDLRQLLEAAGFEVEWAGGVGFPFFNLYRLVTTWRGEQLKQDVAGSPSLTIRLGMAIFEFLFRFNLMSSGWQTVAVARYRPD